MSFDPDAAAAPGTGIFGLPHSRDDSRVVLIPVPFDATTSYRRGTCDGPNAILHASMQVDLYDRRFGRIYERGIHMLPEPERIRELSDDAGVLAADIIAQGGIPEGGPTDGATANALRVINAACEEVNAYVEREVRALASQGKIPGVIGGEHSTPFGAIAALADIHRDIGILHVDAHMDLRDAFEGFTWSHASIMHNVLRRVPGVKKLIQVGIRDFGEREMQLADESGSRVKVHYDDALSDAIMQGEIWQDLCRDIVAELPSKVYVSFDIDALDPSLCPHTGTPVPGGLSFQHAVKLLEALKVSGKEIIGFDLVEVAPGPEDGPEWDANVGARILYKLCGLC
ncbi:MAG: arginase [Tepidisphaera sp.]|nr:arginase [Tepidisphaera sp.]